MRWDLDPESFDCIVSVTALHHMPLEGILAKIREALRPGGVLLVSDLYAPAAWHAALMRAWRSLRKRTARLLGRAHRPPGRNVWQHDPHEKRMSIADIRRAYQAVLPGTRLHVRLSKPGYTAIWHKPHR
jgi:SAM-dependent methyltransferase